MRFANSQEAKKTDRPCKDGRFLVREAGLEPARPE